MNASQWSFDAIRKNKADQMSGLSWVEQIKTKLSTEVLVQENGQSQTRKQDLISTTLGERTGARKYVTCNNKLEKVIIGI